VTGTRAGGLKAAIKNKQNNPNHYTMIGRLGGVKSANGGFASNVIGKDGLTGRQRATTAGSKGGKSKRKNT